MMRFPMMQSRMLRLITISALLMSTTGCKETPAEVREWTPADHKSEAQDPQRTGQTSAATSPAPAGLDEVTIATWSNNCTMCHGQIGRGDGPQAAMTKPRDLTDPKWQAQVTDEQIANSIVQGKGMMPKFALPPSTVQSLVQLVRRLAAIPQAQGAAAANPSAMPGNPTPSASAAHVSPPKAAVSTAASTGKPATAPTPAP
jgi:cytochrome c oxidase cbb3-type subunit 3